jgi:hypothetical protein
MCDDPAPRSGEYRADAGGGGLPDATGRHPERLAQLSAMPPYKIVSRTKDGNVVYTFADPENCHCLHVGGPKEYSSYQRLSVNKKIAEDEDRAAMKLHQKRGGTDLSGTRTCPDARRPGGDGACRSR